MEKKTSILEQRRKELKLSQRVVCEYAGICLKSYYWYIKRERPIPSDVLIKFSEILNCSTDYLLGLKNQVE